MVSFAFVLGVAFLLPGVLHAQTTMVDILSAFTNSLGLFVPVAAALALAVFVWGMVVYIGKTGDDNERIAGRKRMVWGLVGLFVVVSLWGLVVLIQTLVGVDTTLVDCTAPSIDMLGMSTDTCF